MKRSRLIAFLLTAMMLLSTAATGVFALEETGTPAPAGDTGETVLTVEPDVTGTPDNGDGTGTVDGDVTPAPEEDVTAPAAKTIVEGDFTATAAGKEVTLAWKNVSEEDANNVSKIVYKKDGTEETTTSDITPDEKTAREKKLTLDEYNTKYVFELWMTDGESYAATADATTGEEPAPVSPILEAFPTYHAVFLRWNKPEGAERYVITRNDGYTIPIQSGDITSYTDGNNAADVTYSYTIVAYNKSGAASTPVNVASAARVGTCTYRITFKKNVKLTSHDGSKTKYTFKKGQVVYADGFSQGKYQFDWQGHRYHAKWMRIKSPSGNYATNAYMNGVTPTRYVNDAGFSSPTGYLIWISLFSQRVYVFQSTASGWVVVNHDAYGNEGWQCGSGKAKTPTPTGVNKSLHKKMKKYSKHKWWNCFSGNNAIHGSNGQKEIRKLGRLISNGCVRVTNEQAIWIFNTVPKGTRVVVF